MLAGGAISLLSTDSAEGDGGVISLLSTNSAGAEGEGAGKGAEAFKLGGVSAAGGSFSPGFAPAEPGTSPAGPALSWSTSLIFIAAGTLMVPTMVWWGWAGGGTEGVLSAGLAAGGCACWWAEETARETACVQSTE